MNIRWVIQDRADEAKSYTVGQPRNQNERNQLVDFITQVSRLGMSGTRFHTAHKAA